VLRAARAGLAVALVLALIVLGILAFFAAYDLATGRWIDLPLDLLFAAAAIAVLLCVRRLARYARR
jgi:hypothetical protein